MDDIYAALVDASADAPGNPDVSLEDEMFALLREDSRTKRMPEEELRKEIKQHIEDHEEDWLCD